MSTGGEQRRDGFENRLTGAIDGVLHLLDRQLVDSDGELLGKVDDVELTLLPAVGQTRDDPGPTAEARRLAITGVLTGPAALLDRFGGRLGRTLVDRWGQLRIPEPRRTTPWRIDIDDVDRLDSALHLRVRRDGVLRRDRERYRLGRLTGMTVLDAGGRRIGHVLDARFRPHRQPDQQGDGALMLDSLLVGPGRPGSLLGYDRRSDQGPLAVRVIVRWLHRHTTIVDAADTDIDWDRATVQLRSRPVERPSHPFHG